MNPVHFLATTDSYTIYHWAVDWTFANGLHDDNDEKSNKYFKSLSGYELSFRVFSVRVLNSILDAKLDHNCLGQWIRKIWIEWKINLYG